MSRRSARGAARIAVVAIAVMSATAHGRASTCEDLVTELFKRWPCMPPSEELLSQVRSQDGCLKRLLRSTPEPGTAFGAYELLVRTEVKGLGSIVLKAVRDERIEVRRPAVHDLWKVASGDELIEEYLRLLRDPDPGVRYNAVQELQRHPTPTAVPALLAMLSDSSIEVRHSALHAVARWALPATRERLLELSKSADTTLAGVSTFGLRRYYGSQVDLAPVDAYLESQLSLLVGPPYSGTDFVISLIEVLGTDAHPERFKSLSSALKHSHTYVQAAAREALAPL